MVRDQWGPTNSWRSPPSGSRSPSTGALPNPPSTAGRSSTSARRARISTARLTRNQSGPSTAVTIDTAVQELEALKTSITELILANQGTMPTQPPRNEDENNEDKKDQRASSPELSQHHRRTSRRVRLTSGETTVESENAVRQTRMITQVMHRQEKDSEMMRWAVFALVGALILLPLLPRARGEVHTDPIFQEDTDYFVVDGVQVYKGQPNYYRVDAPLRQERQQKLRRVYSMESWQSREEEYEQYLIREALPMAQRLKVDFAGRKWLTVGENVISSFGVLAHSKCRAKLEENDAQLPVGESDVSAIAEVIPSLRNSVLPVFLKPRVTARLLPCKPFELQYERTPKMDPFVKGSCVMPLTVLSRGTWGPERSSEPGVTLADCIDTTYTNWRWTDIEGGKGNCLRFSDMWLFSEQGPEDNTREGLSTCTCTLPEVRLEDIKSRCGVQPLTNLYHDIRTQKKNQMHLMATLDLKAERSPVFNCTLLPFHPGDTPDSQIEADFQAVCLGVKSTKNMFSAPEELWTRNLIHRLKNNELFPLDTSETIRLIRDGFCWEEHCPTYVNRQRDKRALGGLPGILSAFLKPARVMSRGIQRVVAAGSRAAGSVKTSLLKIPGMKVTGRGLGYAAVAAAGVAAALPLTWKNTSQQYTVDPDRSAISRLMGFASVGEDSINDPWELPNITEVAPASGPQELDTPVELNRRLAEINSFANQVDLEGHKIAEFGRLRRTAAITESQLEELEKIIKEEQGTYHVNEEVTLEGEHLGPLSVQETTISILAEDNQMRKLYFATPEVRLYDTTFIMPNLPKEITPQDYLVAANTSCEVILRNQGLVDIKEECPNVQVLQPEFEAQEAGPYYLVTVFKEVLIHVNCEEPHMILGRGYTLLLVNKRCETIVGDHIQPRSLDTFKEASKKFMVLVNQPVIEGQLEGSTTLEELFMTPEAQVAAGSLTGISLGVAVAIIFIFLRGQWRNKRLISTVGQTHQVIQQLQSPTADQNLKARLHSAALNILPRQKRGLLIGEYEKYSDELPFGYQETAV